ncbi:MAG: heparinase II/III family protein [Butyrivibrio sp.]|nr:heparinase II/III family protein [Butyrivibrio sp.]
MSGLNKILLYINTIKYLKFTQIIHQTLNRMLGKRKERLRMRIIQKSRKNTIQSGSVTQAVGMTDMGNKPIWCNIDILIPELDFDSDYLSRYNVEDLLANEIEILHEKHLLDLRKWEVTEASHLWNYNLHYLEFLIPLAVACRNGKTNDKMYDEKYNKTEVYFKKWCEYVNMWIEHPAGDSFEPYTISMRIPNLLICMDILQDKLKGTALERKLIESIYQQYRYLLAAQEKALLANHYFENLKTILICSILFDEKDTYRRYLVKFQKQVNEQILSDGLHYERSILYHKIILEDVLRVYRVLNGSICAAEGLPTIEREALELSSETKCVTLELSSTIKCMADALASVSRGFQRTPLFNDAGDNVAKSTGSLIKAVQKIIGGDISDDKTEFGAAGYYKLYAGKDALNTLIFDCGQIGPSYMGGHAHCDCLSFELSIDGKALFTNSGTYQYQGKLRQFFRSTKAHNTIMIDEREQAELWGEHRAARRMSKIECNPQNQCVIGKCQSYRGDSFLRKINFMEDNIVITDCVHAKDEKKHEARQFFHIVPRYHYEMDSEGQVSVWCKTDKLAVIQIPTGSRGIIHKEGEICAYAQDFGRLEQKEVLEIKTPFEKAAEICVDIKVIGA